MKKTDSNLKNEGQKTGQNNMETDHELLGQVPAQGLDAISLKNKATLKARARALAQEPKLAVEGQELLEIVVFSLGSETYGLESAFVREAIQLNDFTPLPGVPSFVFGITNLRGEIISIVDLKKFFGLPKKGLGQLNKLIILSDNHMNFGILADEILGVRSIAIDVIQDSPITIADIGMEYLRGVTPERVILLNVKKLLCDANIVVHQEVE